MSGNQPSLRTFALPSKGQLLLACRRCQKKIKRTSPRAEIADLKKALKRRSSQGTTRLRILQVPCLKLCPKDAVVVCTQRQLAQGMCSIVRTAADLDVLYAECRAEPATPPPLPLQASSPDHPQSTYREIGRSR